MANGYGHESNQVRSLINLYRTNPNAFDEEHLETLEQMASQQGMDFKPVKDKTTLGSVLKNFGGGFIRGLVPLIPPNHEPKTTYESIAHSLGHLAGFAPSILSLPFRGATMALKGAGAIGLKKTAAKATQKIDEGKFFGNNLVGILDKWSLPMIGSRYIKGKIGHGITKLELDTLDYMKVGGVGRAIAEEAIGLGTASVISDVWAGPDDYMNVFIGGALAGGAFGGIGNWRAIANRLGVANTDIQRKGVESALKATVGASITGLPSTLRRDPIEMQLYEYLLGGFFGYQARPAHEAAGGTFIKSLPNDHPGAIFRPEQHTITVERSKKNPEGVELSFYPDAKGRGGLSKETQKYVLKQSTEQAEKWLSMHDRAEEHGFNPEVYRFEGKWQEILSNRLQNHPARYNKDVIDTFTRRLAEDKHLEGLQRQQIIKSVDEMVSDDRIDPFDEFSTESQVTKTQASREIFDYINKDYVPNKNKNEKKTYQGIEIEDIAKDLSERVTKHTLDSEGNKRPSSDVQSFINEIKETNYGKYLEGPIGNEKLLKKYFHQASKEYKDVLAFDRSDLANGPSITVVKGGSEIDVHKHREFNNKVTETLPTTQIGGEKVYDTPLTDGFGLGSGMQFLKYFKTGLNKYSNINEYNRNQESFFLSSPKEKADLELALYNYRANKSDSGKYIFAGKKDSTTIITAPLVDGISNPKIIQSLGHNRYKVKDLSQHLSADNKQHLLKIFKQSEAGYLKDFKEFIPPDKAKVLHEKQFVSNMLHELKFHFKDHYRFDKLNDIVGDRFFKNAVDYNKRMQLYAESSGVPLNQNSFQDSRYSVIKNNRTNFLVLKDEHFNPSKLAGSSEADGGLIFNTNFFKPIVKAMGMDYTTTIKPAIVGRLLSRGKTEDIGGVIALKSNGEDGAGKPKIQKIMDNHKATTGEDIHFVVFESGNKIKGNTKATNFEFQDNQYKQVGDAEVHSIPLESIRVNLGTYDNASKNFKSVNLPRQFLSTLNAFEAKGYNIKEIVDYYLKGTIAGNEKGIELVNNFKADNNIEPIKTLLKADHKNLETLPLNFVVEKISNPAKENNIFRRALLKNTRNIDHMTESFEIDGHANWNNFYSEMTRLGELAGGNYAPLNFFEKLSRPYENALRKHIVKRSTTPLWKYSGKGSLETTTKDMYTGDNVELRTDIVDTKGNASKLKLEDILTDPNKSNIADQYILLGKSHKKMEAKLNLKPEQLKEIKKFLKKGEKIEDNGDTTLGTVWNLHTNARDSLSKASRKALDNALDLLVIRVPADSISGTIPVKLGGFSESKGTGIVTTKRQDKYLGGADKDIDSAFIIQNGSQSHRKVLEKNKFNREGLSEKELIKNLGAVDPDTSPFTKFSPYYRNMAHQTGLKGSKIRGSLISMRDIYLDILGRITETGKPYRFKGGNKSLDVEFDFSVKKGKEKDFFNNVYTAINIGNDATKYKSIPSFNKFQEKIFDSLFDIKTIKFETSQKYLKPHQQRLKAGNGTARDFFEQLEYLAKNQTPHKREKDFYAEYKTNPYAETNKTLEQFLTLGDRMGDRSSTFSSASGRSLETLYNNKVFDLINNFRDSAFLTEYSNAIKKSIENFNFKEGAEAEKRFAEKFLQISNTILKPQNQIPVDGSKVIPKLKEDLSVNLNKAASYELLTEKALQVFTRLPKDVKALESSDYKVIENLLRDSWLKSRQLLDSLVNGTGQTNDANRRKKYTPEQSEAFDSAVRDHLLHIQKKAKANKISSVPISQFFEQALLTPIALKNKKNEPLDVYRQENVAWGSENISLGSKQESLQRMNDIFMRGYEGAVPKETLVSKDIQNVYQRELFAGIPMRIKGIAEHKDYETFSSFADKAQSSASKVAEKVLKPKGEEQNEKVDNTWNLDVLSFTNADAKAVKSLRENLLKHPQINDSFNEFFIDYTGRTGPARDLKRITIADVRALNNFFEKGKAPKKGLMSWWNWLMDPRDIDRGDLLNTWKKYETYLTDVKSLDKAGKPTILRQQKASTFMSPLGRMREYQRRMQVQQNAEVDPIQEEVLKDLDFKTWMTRDDKTILTKLISNRRNVEEARLEGKEYKDFLTRKIKHNKTEQIKTGEEWLNLYDKKVTEFYDAVAKEWLFTYNKVGGRIDFRKDIDLNPDFQYGKVTDFIRYFPSGRFDFKHFRKTVIDPMEKTGKAPKVGMESLMRYQWESSMEKSLIKKHGAKNITEAHRRNYRQDNNFLQDYGFGYIVPDQYWSRTNYGADNAAKRRFEESVKVAAQKAADAEIDPKKKKEAYKKKLAQFSLLREDSYHPSAGLEKQFLNENYETPGYGSKPQNLLQRGKDFIDGYDVSPTVFENYKNQVVRSYFSNLTAIHGNTQIGKLKYGTEIPDLKNLNKDLQKHNKKITKKARKLFPESAKARKKYMQKHKYKDNADMWGDFLYIYLKNSLGHPSLLTDRIVKSMETADPLKLKHNPYYYTSDYAVTRGLEKLHKNNLFNKMPFLKNAPKDKTMRRDYFVRRLHDLGTMEAKYNLLTLLANTGTMMTNLYGGGVTTMGSAGFRSWADAQSNRKVTEKLLTDVKGDFILSLKSGNSVKNRKDLIKWMDEQGVLDSYIQGEFDYNPELRTSIARKGKDAKSFMRDVKKLVKDNAKDETILQLAKRYGISDAMLQYGGFFMKFSERKNRIDAFIAHALKAKERLGSEGIHANLNDPFIFDTALKGIETTQFLYHSAFRPAFMTTALGKVLTRFKLFAFQSVRVRKEFYNQAKAYGFNEGTDEYKKLKDLFLTDLFSYALGGAFMYSLFDTALPPPWDWVQDTSDLMFGDKKERDRAFYGTLPRPIAPLQAALPPIARFPQTFVELVQGDWEKFSNYTVHTMYPGGRLIYSGIKTYERPDTFWQNFFRIPKDKIGRAIDREKLIEARKEMIEEELEI